MRKTLHKWFWAWDFDKEEQWLNVMAAKGLVLVGVGFLSYTFEERAGEYGIRLELLEQMPSHPESEQYIRFVEETGAEYIGATMRWVYFRKKKEQGEFVLFSDHDSRMKHLNRLLTLLGVLTVSELSIGIINVSHYFRNHRFIINLVAGILVLGVGLLLSYGFLRVYQKKRKQKKEKRLYE